MAQDQLTIANKTFGSRLIVGTGKFPSNNALKSALDASEAEIVTVALRRIDLNGKFDNILDAIDKDKYTLLPNTSGARTAEEAIRIARLAKATGAGNWIKLEVTSDQSYLFPDPIETLKATEELVKEGFVVLPYINADPVLAKRLEDAGASTVMPLGSPIGSHQGLKAKNAIEIIIEQANVPVIVDAGIGSPSHAAEAMEMGADAVMINTAISIASDPAAMAEAFKLAVKAGRLAYLVGLSAPKHNAAASSPLTGFLR
ncbi:thiazole synthase [Candidatus Saganbacteria bacterium]|nr:thiazole synthase [Candidatus Saganbacteria bacterium]